MQFGVTVESAVYDDDATAWHLHLDDGRELTSHFLVLAIGLLSAPTMPRYEGIDEFRGQSFHTYNWPVEPVDMAGKRVGVIGTGATAVQLIGEIADKVGELTVFQRRPNWCAPLHNAEIPPEEMADIKARYDEIFALCARTPGGFIHEPDRRPFFEVPREERLAKWEQLYGEPGFGIWLANFRDTFMDEEANAELSAFIADKIRERVARPRAGREADPQGPRLRRPAGADGDAVLRGVQPRQRAPRRPPGDADRAHHADRHPHDRRRHRARHHRLRHRLRCRSPAPTTASTSAASAGSRCASGGPTGRTRYFGLQVPGFPNMFMPTGPQSGSASTNFPRGIEIGVDWCTDLMRYMWEHGYSREEATPEAAAAWDDHVRELYGIMLMRKAQGWFTGYNSNVDGHEKGTIRYLVYNGGTPKFRKKITEAAEAGYAGITFR